MSAIGTLKAKGEGYSFAIKTLTQKISGDVVPVKEKVANGPDFRVFLADQTQVGAAWIKQSENGDVGNESYLSFSFDDPFLPAPLYVNSYKRNDNTIILLWSRSTR
jgi:uncharacterized protein (DUF736 family)